MGTILIGRGATNYGVYRWSGGTIYSATDGRPGGPLNDIEGTVHSMTVPLIQLEASGYIKLLNLMEKDVAESKMFPESSLANSSPLLLQDSACPVDTEFHNFSIR